MTKPNIFSLPSTISEDPIKEGDALLIIRKDGKIDSATIGIDQKLVEAVSTKDPEDLTSEELDVALQGQTLFLLSMAASSEEIMSFLAKVAALPGDIDINKLSRAATMN